MHTHLHHHNWQNTTCDDAAAEKCYSLIDNSSVIDNTSTSAIGASPTKASQVLQLTNCVPVCRHVTLHWIIMHLSTREYAMHAMHAMHAMLAMLAASQFDVTASHQTIAQLQLQAPYILQQ